MCRPSCPILIFGSAINRYRSALSDRKFSVEQKLIFEGVKLEISLVDFQPQSLASTI